MSRWASLRWSRMGYAAATGAGLGSLLFWVGYWVTFVRGNLQGPDFFSFYSGAKLFVLKGGSAVYDLALQKQYELQVIPHPPDRFVVLPYFHPPYYTLLIAPLAYLDYRTAYYAMAAVNVVLAAGLIVLLVRGSERIRGRSAVVAAALIGGFFPLFVTVLQGQSDLVVLVPLAAAYTAWARGRLGWAGIFTGLALAKPQLLLLVPVLFITRRAWRALAGFAAVIAALGAVSVVGFGLAPVLGYLNAVGRWAIGGTLPTNGQIVYTDTAVYSLRNVLEAVPGGGKGLALAILILLLALVALSLSWRPDKPRLDFALAIAASLVLSPHQNVHDLALLVIPGFALADLALAGDLRWPRAAALVLVLAYAAINLTLALDLWSAAIGAFAIAAYLTVERMAVRPDPIPLGELRWSGPQPRRVIVLPAYRAAKTLGEVVGDIPAGHADRILLVDDASADATVSVATALRLDVIRHQRNLGYGGNQKTCYRHALDMGADVVVMLHPDGQYGGHRARLSLVRPGSCQSGDAVVETSWQPVSDRRRESRPGSSPVRVSHRVSRVLAQIPGGDSVPGEQQRLRVRHAGTDPGSDVWFQDWRGACDRQVPRRRQLDELSYVNGLRIGDVVGARSIRHAPRRFSEPVAHAIVRCRQTGACDRRGSPPRQCSVAARQP